MNILRKFPEKEVIILCGHTHGEGMYKPADNITVITSPAEYGEPQVAGVIEI